MKLCASWQRGERAWPVEMHRVATNTPSTHQNGHALSPAAHMHMYVMWIIVSHICKYILVDLYADTPLWHIVLSSSGKEQLGQYSNHVTKFTQLTRRHSGCVLAIHHCIYYLTGVENAMHLHHCPVPPLHTAQCTAAFTRMHTEPLQWKTVAHIAPCISFFQCWHLFSQPIVRCCDSISSICHCRTQHLDSDLALSAPWLQNTLGRNTASVSMYKALTSTYILMWGQLLSIITAGPQ